MKRRFAIESHPSRCPDLSTEAQEDALLEDSINGMVGPSGERMKNILVVDSDLGFVYWLGCTLCAAGYMALPAKDSQNASELLSRLKVGIQLLVVNPSMPEARDFAEALRRSQRHLKVIALLGGGEGLGRAFPGADASQHKRTYLGEFSEIDWLETIENVFARDAATTPDLRSSAGKPS
jgi:hypothetical protein